MLFPNPATIRPSVESNRMRALSIFFLVSLVSIPNAGCLDPYVISVDGGDIQDEIDINYEALPVPHDEYIYSSSPDISVRTVIKRLKENEPAVRLVDSAAFWNAVVSDTDKLTPADLFSSTCVERMRAINVDVVAIVGASQLEVTGRSALRGTMSALLISTENPLRRKQITVQVTSRHRVTPLMFPPPVLFEVHGDGTFAPEISAQEVMSGEIMQYLASAYDRPPGLVVLWPVTRETEHARRISGCTGTWEEIKECRNGNE